MQIITCFTHKSNQAYTHTHTHTHTHTQCCYAVLYIYICTCTYLIQCKMLLFFLCCLPSLLVQLLVWLITDVDKSSKERTKLASILYYTTTKCNVSLLAFVYLYSLSLSLLLQHSQGSNLYQCVPSPLDPKIGMYVDPYWILQPYTASLYTWYTHVRLMFTNYGPTTHSLFLPLSPLLLLLLLLYLRSIG